MNLSPESVKKTLLNKVNELLKKESIIHNKV